MKWALFADANALYSRTIRDWLFLLHLEAPDDIAVYTSEDVLAEVIYHYRRNHPKAPGGLIASIRRAISSSVQDIVSQYEIDPALPTSDENDRHVYAATAACRANFLVTSDKGFASSSSLGLGFTVLTPDELFCQIETWDPVTVRAVVERQITYWSACESSVTLPQALVRAGCSRFAKCVELHIHSLG